MNTKLMQGQYKKILSNINKKYNLGFDEIFTKKGSYLCGIIGTRLIWIYLYDGEIVLEETNYLKGKRYKRNQGKEVVNISEEKINEIEHKVREFITTIKKNEKINKVKKIFKKNEESALEQSFIYKINEFIKMIYKIKETNTPYETTKKEVETLFSETKYKTFEQYGPLLIGLTYHKNFSFKNNEDKNITVSVIKNASNKVFYMDKNEQKLKVFGTEKDFIENYLADSSVFI